MKPLTIIDIARLAGVGKSTVSRVINNDSRVKSATRDKVLAVIKKHKFSPSKSARSMRSGTSGVVGIIVSRLDSYAENRAIRGILDELYAQNIDVIIMESGFNNDNIRQHVEILSKRSVDGLIVFALTGDNYHWLKPYEIPTVMIGQVISDFPSIVYDDSGAINLIMEHLANKKVTNTLYIGVDTCDSTTGLKRFQTYQQNCDSCGLTPRFLLGELKSESGYKLARQGIRDNTEAIICATDTLAIGVYRYLQEINRIDVLVAGTGQNKMLNYLYPQHISINLSYKLSGSCAARTLVDLISGKNVQGVEIMPCKLC